jgi:hypothetical protein
VSLAAGGRLDSLLGAADFATSPAVDPGGDVGRALCLAVDPDLLVTVNAMTAGYVVADARRLGTAAQPGTGQAAAAAWLDRLRTLAGRMCVVATPYAQADLGRCSGSATGGSAPPTTTTADIVDQILGIGPVRGTTLLGDEPLTPMAVDLLDGKGATVAIAAAPPTRRTRAPANRRPRTSPPAGSPRWCWRRSTRRWVPPWLRWARPRPPTYLDPAWRPAEPRLHRRAATGRGRPCCGGP